MANAAAKVDTPRKISCYDMKHSGVVATGQTIYQGQMVGLNSSGLVVGTAFVRALGRAMSSIASSPAGYVIEWEQGIFRWQNGGTGTLTQANRGTLVYAADNQTVNSTNTNPPAGTMYELDASGAVWVLMQFLPAAAVS